VPKSRLEEGNYRGNLKEAVMLWPTPTVGDSRNSARHTTTTGKSHDGTTLVDATRVWPTPTARDYKGQNSAKHLAKPGGHHNQLPNAVALRGNVGALNPTWVEWLMGFPSGWTDLSR
jgi:hypothetical protein